MLDSVSKAIYDLEAAAVSLRDLRLATDLCGGELPEAFVARAESKLHAARLNLRSLCKQHTAERR